VLDEAVRQQMAALADLGFGESGHRLSALLGTELRLERTEVALWSAEDLIRAHGRGDDGVVAVVSRLTGDLTGAVLLLFTPASARCLEEMLLQADENEEMRSSLLSEVGNIAAGSFLTVLGDWLGVRLSLTPPVAVRDLLGAVLGTVLPLVELVPDRVVGFGTNLIAQGRPIAATFLFLPDAAAYARIRERVARAAGR
jgi:chemotaxis protein CheC